MKKEFLSTVFFISALVFPAAVVSQHYTLSNNSSIIVSGTSSLHDWDVEAESFSGKIEFDDFDNGVISNIDITVIAESLKSGKKAMDKNTYKALMTDKYKSITFKLGNIQSINRIDDYSYKLVGKGNLTVAGASKIVNLNFLLTKINGSNKVGCTITGSCTIKMTEFGIKPPKALMGAIKTGDEVTIKFNTSFISE